jgi:hypothetical protein
MPIGMLKVHRKKIGIDLRHDCINCSLPPYASREELAVSLLSIRSTIGNKSCIDGLVVPNGNPKYVKGITPTLQPKSLAKTATSSSDKFKGNMQDL